MSWPTLRFEQLYAEPSRNGVYKPTQFHGSGVRIVNMGELFAFDIISNQEMNRLAMNDAEMAKSGLRDGDLLFGRRSLVEAGAGKCSLVEGLSEPTTFESSIIRVRVDENRLKPRFIYYWLKSHSGRGAIRAIVTGTNVKGIRSSVLKDIEVPCPTTETQDRIVERLRAYDNLIENNRRRIQLLEQAARLLYKEWFVHLRFPGHEHAKIKDGVPEGWEKKHLAELMDTQYGFTETATAEPVGPQFLRGTDINKTSYIDWSNVPYCPDDKLDYNKYALKINDIVVIRMADPGKVAIVESEVKAIFASYLVRLIRKNGVTVPPLYLFYVLSDDGYQGFISGACGGATRKSANAKLLVDFNVVIPPATLVSMFIAQVEALRSQIQTLLKQNSCLVKARDLLLPRIMNGVIAV